MLDFFKVLNGERSDGVIWTADLSYWINARQHDGTADPAWETEEGYLQLHRDLGVMPYYYYEKFWVAEAVYANTVRLCRENQGDREIRILETPVGSLREESVFLASSCCHGVVKHMVETEADLDVMLYVLEHRTLEPRNLEDYPRRRELWAGYGGLPCLGMPRSPLSALAYEWAGLQSMVMLMFDCEDKVMQALALLEAQEEPILQAVRELAAPQAAQTGGQAPPLVHFPDNLSSDNLTGYYDVHMRDRHRGRIERLHAAGIKCAVHLDGAVRGLLPELAASGFDAIEALTPKPAGDLFVDEMRDVAAKDGVVLWGGVPGVMFAPPYTWSEMEKHIEHVLECWKDQPFVLGVADQVPPDGDIEMVRKISGMIRDL